MVALLKQAIQVVSRSRAFDLGMSLLERRLGRDDDLLRVLMYHRVDHATRTPDLWPGMIGPTPEEFTRQIELLSANYHVVSLAEVVAAIRGSATLPARAVLITFDDAYRDFAVHSWPILKQHGLPATIFVATGYLDESGRHFWWDRLYRAIQTAPAGTCLKLSSGPVRLENAGKRNAVFRRLKEHLKAIPHAECVELVERVVAETGVPDADDNGVLSWSELAQLHFEGVTLAPHTHSHPMLNQLPASAMHDEISRSWIELVERFGPKVPKVLAYPAGGVSDEVVRVVQDLGFDAALGTRRGVNRLSSIDSFRIRRINVGARTTLGLLRAQLAAFAG